MHNRSSDHQSDVPITVIDDEPEARRGYTIALSMAGFTNVRTFAEGRSALDTLSPDETGVVILDLNLPGLSGEDVLKKLKSKSPETEVIVVSAAQELQRALNLLRMGCREYLPKPVESAQLVGAVERAAEVHALVRENAQLRRYLVSTQQQKIPTGDALSSTVLRSARDEFHAILNQIPIPTFAYDQTNNRLVHCNLRFAAFFGFDSVQDALSHFPIRSLLAPASARELRDRLSHSHEVTDMEVEGKDITGKHFVVALSCRCAPDDDLCQGAFVDITAVKESERELRTALERNERLMMEIHHRVRNNLQVITGLVSMGISDAPEGEALRQLERLKLHIGAVSHAFERITGPDRIERIPLFNYLHDIAEQSTRIRSDVSLRHVMTESRVLVDIDAAVPAGVLLIEVLLALFTRMATPRTGETMRVTIAYSATSSLHDSPSVSQEAESDFDVRIAISGDSRVALRGEALPRSSMLDTLLAAMRGTYQTDPEDPAVVVLTLRGVSASL